MTRHPVIMPKVGMYLEDMRLVEWLKAEGAEVRPGDLLFTFESDKATSEVEAEVAGFLHRVRAADEMVSIGAEVGVIVETHEEYEALLAEPTRSDTPEENARETASELAAGASAVGRAARGAERPRVSPRARALLAGHGIAAEHIAHISGAGPGGRIVERDVEAFLASRSRGGPRVAERIPFRGRRAVIAARMLESLANSAQLTSILEIDVLPIVSWRERSGSGTSYTAIFLKLGSLALRKHPVLNSRLAGEQIEVFADVNVGFAVDTEDGVLVPVVHGADLLPLSEVETRVRELTQKARTRGLDHDDLEGGTFTLSNSGTFSVDITTAVINPPQAGILWTGRIRERPIAVHGRVVVHPTVQTCLTFDHRIVDGAPAARFLGTFEALVSGFPETLA